jgi:hypothetical protein
MKIVSAIILACFCSIVANAKDACIFIDGKINNKPVRFIFDTGSDTPFVLFSATIQKLGLKVTPPPTNNQVGPGEIAVGYSELCNMDIANTNVTTRFAVLDSPAYLKWGADGILGWPALSNNIFSVDFANHTFTLFTNIPDASPGWFELPIPTNTDDLTLELSSGKSQKLILALDSGCDYGVKLNPQRWHDWKSAHANQPFTMQAYYTPNPGLVVTEESWADKISLGLLTLTDVPVMEADSGDVALHSSPQTKFEATLGFAALKRLDIIIDGKHGVAYLRPKQAPALPYDHNRLGAVFVPLNLQEDDGLTHVLDGSPAYEAGIRHDDVLLKIGDLDVTKWRTDPNVLPLSRFWDQPAGTKIELTVKRGDKIFKTTVVLRNILPPDAPKNPN